jgi:hypothetical protein
LDPFARATARLAVGRPMKGERRFKCGGGSSKIAFQFFRCLINHRGSSKANPAGLFLLQARHFAGQGFAVDKLKEMKPMAAPNGNHGAQRRINPVNQKFCIFSKMTRRLAQQRGKGRSERACAFKTRINLGCDHRLARLERCKPFAQTALTRHFQKSHSKLSPERATHCRRI